MIKRSASGKTVETPAVPAVPAVPPARPVAASASSAGSAGSGGNTSSGGGMTLEQLQQEPGMKDAFLLTDTEFVGAFGLSKVS